jgi:hypothetical protein
MVAAASMIRNEKKSFMQTGFAAALRGGAPALGFVGFTWRLWLVPARLHMVSFSWRGEQVQKKAENRVMIWCYNALMLLDTIVVSIPIGLFCIVDLVRALKENGFVLNPEKHLWLLIKLTSSTLCAISSAYFASKSPEINRPLSSY